MVLSFKIWGREDDNNSTIHDLALLLLILLSNIIFITNQNLIRDRSKITVRISLTCVSLN